MNVSSKVPPAFTDLTVEEYLGTRFTYHSVEKWIERINEGRIIRNNEICFSGMTVSGGDTITYKMPDFDEPKADLSYSIVYMDEKIICINKPPNLAVHRAGKQFRNNLIYHLRYEHQPAYPDSFIVNRLDRDTSGLVLAARDRRSAAFLHRQFAEKKVEKRYSAVVHGVPHDNEGVIDFPIAKIDSGEGLIKYGINGKNPKNALTRYSIVENIHNRFCLVDITLVTGRTHQIRVHMSAAGCPLVGDRVYGSGADESIMKNEQYETVIKRQALHCRRMAFIHPASGEKFSVESGMPEDLKKLVNILKNSME